MIPINLFLIIKIISIREVYFTITPNIYLLEKSIRLDNKATLYLIDNIKLIKLRTF